MECLRCGCDVETGKALCDNCIKEAPLVPQDSQKVKKAILRHIEAITQVSSLEYAGFWLRALATFIDAYILSLLQYAFWTAIIFYYHGSVRDYLEIQNNPFGHADRMLTNSIKGMLWFYLIPTIFYFGFFESSRFQGTPGKILLGIKVTDLNGDRFGFFKGIFRTLARFSNLVSTIPTIILVLASGSSSLLFLILSLLFAIGSISYSYIMAAFTEQRQALHDKVASTLVVKSPSFSQKRLIAGLILALWLFVLSFTYIYSEQDKFKNLKLKMPVSSGNYPSSTQVYDYN